MVRVIWQIEFLRATEQRSTKLHELTLTKPRNPSEGGEGNQRLNQVWADVASPESFFGRVAP